MYVGKVGRGRTRSLPRLQANELKKPCSPQQRQRPLSIPLPPGQSIVYTAHKGTRGLHNLEEPPGRDTRLNPDVSPADGTLGRSFLPALAPFFFLFFFCPKALKPWIGERGVPRSTNTTNGCISVVRGRGVGKGPVGCGWPSFFHEYSDERHNKINSLGRHLVAEPICVP